MTKPNVAILCLCILGVGILAGCSSEPAKPATAEKPKPQAITGMSAIYKCYTPARGWAGDAQPYRIEFQLASNRVDRPFNQIIGFGPTSASVRILRNLVSKNV